MVINNRIKPRSQLPYKTRKFIAGAALGPLQFLNFNHSLAEKRFECWKRSSKRAGTAESLTWWLLKCKQEIIRDLQLVECVEINNVFAEGNAEVMETAVNDPGKKHWAAQGRAVEWQDRDMNKDTANKPLNLFLEAQTGSVSLQLDIPRAEWHLQEAPKRFRGRNPKS